MAKKSQDDYDGVIYEPSDYIDPKRNRNSGRTLKRTLTAGFGRVCPQTRAAVAVYDILYPDAYSGCYAVYRDFSGGIQFGV
jgi:hypothetical protein